jgi:hypothetical protein
MTSTTPARPRTATAATALIRSPGTPPRPRRWRPLTAVTRRALKPAATTGPRAPVTSGCQAFSHSETERLIQRSAVGPHDRSSQTCGASER